MTRSAAEDVKKRYLIQSPRRANRCGIAESCWQGGTLGACPLLVRPGPSRSSCRSTGTQQSTWGWQPRFWESSSTVRV